MPTKAVVQHDCERCKRTWYEDKQAPVAKLIVRMETSDGEKFEGSFDVLCKGCEKTVRNSFQSILRDMRKKSSERGKRRAKKEGTTTPLEPNGSTAPSAPLVLDIPKGRTPTTAALQPLPSALSKQR